YAEYFDFLRKKGIRQNLSMMAGHNTAMHSLVGDKPKKPTSAENMQKTKDILNEGMNAGTKGISFGLGYKPSIFIPDTELREIANIAIKRNKLITVHSRVLGSMAPDVYGNDASEPHNLRWHREWLNLFKGSGARLHISHLLFVGRSAWPYYDEMMALVQNAMDNFDIDLWFDMYSYIQGPTTLGILMPQVFYDSLPQIYTDKALVKKLDEALKEKELARGIRSDDVMLCNPIVPELEEYKGMYMSEICEARKMTLAELYIDIYKRTNGFAQVYLMIEQPEENVPKQMTHPRALYMTDANYEPNCQQNPSAYGSLAKFLRLTRETGNQPMEVTVQKMTGNTAKRFDLFGRGFIREGYYADITIFDPATIAERATSKDPEQSPVGLHHVFINGQHVLNEDNLDEALTAGMVL
ncbi:hypothetical protein LJB83_02475, partial [Clostridia bacterium OttesenSCG-928-F22]|nr:hypothetical protein [Clostridia bacterium OttesenSCG-928-F22]